MTAMICRGTKRLRRQHQPVTGLLPCHHQTDPSPSAPIRRQDRPSTGLLPRQLTSPCTRPNNPWARSLVDRSKVVVVVVATPRSTARGSRPAPLLKVRFNDKVKRHDIEATGKQYQVPPIGRDPQ